MTQSNAYDGLMTPQEILGLAIAQRKELLDTLANSKTSSPKVQGTRTLKNLWGLKTLLAQLL